MSSVKVSVFFMKVKRVQMRKGKGSARTGGRQKWAVVDAGDQNTSWECYNDTHCICNYYTLIKTLITFCYQFNCYFSHYYSHLIALVMLQLESKALCILGKQFPTEL